MTTIKIKPSHASQGDFVIIEESDFDPAIHSLLDSEEPKEPEKLSIGAIRTALKEKGIEFHESAKKQELQALLDSAQ